MHGLKKTTIEQKENHVYFHFIQRICFSYMMIHVRIFLCCFLVTKNKFYAVANSENIRFCQIWYLAVRRFHYRCFY